MAKTSIKELKALYEASEKERYHLDDMWPEDLTDALASGDIPKLEEAWENGWNVNMPIKSIYQASLKEAMKEAKNNFEKFCGPLPGLEEYFIESHAEERIKKDVAETIHAEIVFPLAWAIKQNCIASVEWLIQHGARLDVKSYPSGEYLANDNQHAAIAACNVSEEMFGLVVGHGAKVKDKTFDFFLFNSSLDKLKWQMPILMEHGADIEAAIMAVQSAAYYGDINRMEYFLNAGFDINCHTGKGQNFLKDTVLGHAAEYGTPDTIRYLLSRGADPTIRNAKGMTPYDLALQNHKMENASILRDLCDPDGEGRRQAQEKLPQDIIEYLKDGGRRLELGRDDIKYIDFLALDDVALLRLGRRKCVLLSKEVENFPTIWIVWNTARKTVAYYDYENEWYGEFKVSFTEFLEEIGKYVTGIFRGNYEL